MDARVKREKNEMQAKLTESKGLATQIRVLLLRAWGSEQKEKRGPTCTEYDKRDQGRNEPDGRETRNWQLGGSCPTRKQIREMGSDRRGNCELAAKEKRVGKSKWRGAVASSGGRNEGH